MENTKALLHEAKRKTDAATDYQLAKRLGITTAEVSMYYSGKRHPNEYVCMQIARATGRSLEEVITLVRIDAERNETRRNAWRDYLKHLGGHAASIALAVSAIVILEMTPTTAEAAPLLTSGNGIFCIMLNLLWIIQGQTKLRMIAFPCTFGVFVRQVRQVTA